MKVALFAPCFIDQLFPHVAIAALNVLERLGVTVAVPEGAVCCGQPAANAGFEDDGDGALARFVSTFAPHDTVIVLSGSCAMHVRLHATAEVARKTTELCTFLHDEIGLDAVAALGVSYPQRVGVHIGCHALRGLGVARPSEIREAPFDKVRALLGTVRGLTIAELARADECCGFGGSFAVGEPAVSAKMGRDRLRDYQRGGATAIVSTDMSCMMHLGGLARRADAALPMLHVAEILAGMAS
jgi:L-lactate dehydrogenase complex protein LldE